MGLGRDQREKILEEEHYKYLEDIASKKREEWLESETRFMKLYEQHLRKDVNILMVAVCILLSAVGAFAFVIWQLIKAFS